MVFSRSQTASRLRRSFEITLHDFLPLVVEVRPVSGDEVSNFAKQVFSQCYRIIMATPISEECYSDEEEDIVTSNFCSAYGEEDEEIDEEHGGLSGWQIAARGIQLALNNRIEDAQNLLRVDSSCIHRQAGFCYLTFIVSNVSNANFGNYVRLCAMNKF